MNTNNPSREIEDFWTDAFTSAWTVFMKDIVTYIIAGLLVAVVGAISLGIMAGPLAVGFIRMVKAGIRGEEIGIGDIFNLGMPSFGPAFVVVLLIGIGAAIGTLALVIGALVVPFLCIYSLHMIAYENTGVRDSLTGSFEIVKENLVTTVVLFVAMAVLSAAGGAILGLGTLVTTPFSLILATVVFERLHTNTKFIDR